VGALRVMEQAVEGLFSSLVSSALESLFFEERAVEDQQRNISELDEAASDTVISEEHAEQQMVMQSNELENASVHAEDEEQGPKVSADRLGHAAQVHNLRKQVEALIVHKKQAQVDALVQKQQVLDLERQLHDEKTLHKLVTQLFLNVTEQLLVTEKKLVTEKTLHKLVTQLFLNVTEQLLVTEKKLNVTEQNLVTEKTLHKPVTQQKLNVTEQLRVTEQKLDVAEQNLRNVTRDVTQTLHGDLGRTIVYAFLCIGLWRVWWISICHAVQIATPAIPTSLKSWSRENFTCLEFQMLDYCVRYVKEKTMAESLKLSKQRAEFMTHWRFMQENLDKLHVCMLASLVDMEQCHNDNFLRVSAMESIMQVSQELPNQP
jgi:hypothetical protein